ncbi:RNA polymerase, sigma-24 subunit, RpoE [Candidatus Kryptonium thompsonii]|uniref:RNA polymerase sigma factor n=1 Tax=Candidatus Kryptonium thompsonii TaxID=1633631 RepID=A0A0P1MAM8_9BACT|nr:sigma-70 family RNA polymerase sigma factor [Candidatus Kryptonium thompsoni]CUS79275.1 RNA polymerase, sigma-24 subunit, RpoE [Candidatus Kryptonium thompsoni]CUS81468.1 RNA polymerase, sigma-24 subunit, RpoE [Candidatus Kryptonium thompsoni]CUS86628.1 RNA polymerase, sigma-24 subunit, RpoE [Candidatus Kryptonium thompsoni]CUS90200.1 RNA polymerase, sigma-24 subunit, RpoE [Candidatus Kryptonium thompsoni]CUS90458.1 RNA polymerase, sigma-24 subunit, RpoE [Candidatus Kryptonium thompsoni]
MNKQFETLDEVEIVQLAKDGDEKAFEFIVKKYQNKVANLIFKIIGDASIVEDLTQEVFLRVIESLKEYKFGSALYTWIYRITVNICIDEIRRRQRSRAYSLSDVLSQNPKAEPSHSHVEKTVEQKEMREIIEEAISKLPPEYKTALILREFEDLPYEEIARVLKIRVGTVKSRIFRARKLLAEHLKEYKDLLK